MCRGIGHQTIFNCTSTSQSWVKAVAQRADYISMRRTIRNGKGQSDAVVLHHDERDQLSSIPPSASSSSPSSKQTHHPCTLCTLFSKWHLCARLHFRVHIVVDPGNDAERSQLIRKCHSRGRSIDQGAFYRDCSPPGHRSPPASNPTLHRPRIHFIHHSS